MVSEEGRRRRLALLMQEAPAGLAERLEEPGFQPVFSGLSGEARAVYYSLARRNMSSVVAEAVMAHCQQLGDLEILRKIGRILPAGE